MKTQTLREDWKKEFDNTFNSDETYDAGREKFIKFIRSLLHRTRKEVRESTDKEARTLCEMKKRALLSRFQQEIRECIKEKKPITMKEVYEVVAENEGNVLDIEVIEADKRNRFIYNQALSDIKTKLKEKGLLKGE